MHCQKVARLASFLGDTHLLKFVSLEFLPPAVLAACGVVFVLDQISQPAGRSPAKPRRPASFHASRGWRREDLKLLLFSGSQGGKPRSYAQVWGPEVSRNNYASSGRRTSRVCQSCIQSVAVNSCLAKSLQPAVFFLFVVPQISQQTCPGTPCDFSSMSGFGGFQMSNCRQRLVLELQSFNLWSTLWAGGFALWNCSLFQADHCPRSSCAS